MAKRKRRTHGNKQKAEVLKKRLTDEVSVSDLCDEYQPSVFYQWQKLLVDNLELAMEALSTKSKRQANTREREPEKKVAAAQAWRMKAPIRWAAEA